MVIDLNRCIGCYACMLACKQEHFLPPKVFWGRVLVGELGKYPVVQKLIYPVLCNHCEEAACVEVCPTGASTKRKDGIVMIDYDKCVGCRYCMMACPYQQRSFHSNNKDGYFPSQGLTEPEVLGSQLYPFQEGTVMKCNFCMERIDAGIEKGLEPGVDRDATPACVTACPAKARYFGDLDSDMGKVAEILRQKKVFQLHPEFGTNPSVYYIAK